MNAEDLVRTAEAAHAAMDLDRIMACFEPTIVAYWNGRLIASNEEQLRAWYAKFFARQTRFEIDKTLCLASPERLAVEWTHRRTDTRGRSFEAHAAEIWFLSARQRLSEWHAYCVEYAL